MGSALEYSPWSARHRSRRAFTAFGPRTVRAILVGGAALIAAEALALGLLMESAATAWRVTAQIAAGAVLGLVALAVAYRTPTYDFSRLRTEHLGSGAILITGEKALGREAGMVSRVFLHHGKEPPIACIGLADGREFDRPLSSSSLVAVPHDLFRRLRNRSPIGRERPVQPSEECLLALVAIWDTRLRLAEEEITVSEVAEEYARTFPRVWADVDLDRLLQEAAELRLLRRRSRGVRKHAQEYVEMTGLGNVTLSQELRERGIEVHTDAGKEIPVTQSGNSMIHNSGIIITGSPGAVANLGSGQAIGGLTPEVAGALRRLVEHPDAVVEAAEAEGADAGSEGADAGSGSSGQLALLRERIADLEHELQHPAATEPRLKRAAGAVAEVGAAAVAGFLGNAAWGALAAWLGIPPGEGGD